MFDHLREDWPWIVVPCLIVAAIAVVVALVLASGDGAMFTYDV
ncbi:MAG: hypothetical protein AAF726_07575 [Planctomycetota bacterium]